MNVKLIDYLKYIFYILLIILFGSLLIWNIVLRNKIFNTEKKLDDIIHSNKNVSNKLDDLIKSSLLKDSLSFVLIDSTINEYTNKINKTSKEYEKINYSDSSWSAERQRAYWQNLLSVRSDS